MKEQILTTKPKWYVDAEERVISINETSRHHIAFPRRLFLGQTALTGFRNAGGFNQRLADPWHRELHANVKPPIIPNINLRNEIIQLQKPLEGHDTLERLDATMEFLERMAIKSGVLTPNSRDSWDLLENLREQREYVVLGRVVLLSSQ